MPTRRSGVGMSLEFLHRRRVRSGVRIPAMDFFAIAEGAVPEEQHALIAFSQGSLDLNGGTCSESDFNSIQTLLRLGFLDAGEFTSVDFRLTGTDHKGASGFEAADFNKMRDIPAIAVFAFERVRFCGQGQQGKDVKQCLHGSALYHVLCKK